MKKLDELIETFKKVMDAIKGRRDIKSKLSVLTNPENPDTMTVLNKGEARLLSSSNFLAESETWGEMFKPLQRYAQSIREPNISVNGRGRDDVIKYVQAMNEAKAVKKTEGTKEGKVESGG